MVVVVVLYSAAAVSVAAVVVVYGDCMIVCMTLLAMNDHHLNYPCYLALYKEVVVAVVDVVAVDGDGDLCDATGCVRDVVAHIGNCRISVR